MSEPSAEAVLIPGSPRLAEPAAQQPPRPGASLDWGPLLLGVQALLLVVSIAATLLVDSPPPPRDAALLLVGSLLAAVQCLRAAFAARSAPRTSRGWAFVAAGLLAWAAGDYRYYLLDEYRVGVAPATHALYFLYYLLTVVGLVQFPSAASVNPLRLALDMATVALGGTLAMSYLVLQPLAQSGGRPSADVAAVVPYAVADLVLLLASLILVFRPVHRESLPAFRVLALAQLLSFLGGLVYAVEAFVEDHFVYMKGYLLVQLLLGVAAHLHRDRVREPLAPQAPADARASLNLLPYGAIAVGLTTLVYAAAREGGRALYAPMLLLAALTVVVVARQIVALREETRLLAEREARRGEERARSSALLEWRDTFDAIRSPLVVLDAAGRVACVNESAARLAGGESASVVGLTLAELGAGPPWSAAARLAEDVRLVGGPAISIAQDEARGRSFRLEARTFPSGARRESRVILAIEDITDKHRADSERERLLAELEAKNAELERFTYSVSHDLKSPLITIRGFVDQLGVAVREGNAERVQGDLDRIASAASQMHRLLGDLLELSRVGLVVNPLEPVSLRAVAEEAAARVAGRLAGIEVLVAEDLPVVRGDRPRLLEVLENLLDNASQFRGEKPHARVEIGVRRDGPEPVFYVRDFGIGIEPRHHERIFQLFQKLDPRSPGTGVGLALARRIVESHGGRLWVESEGQGRGATFYFTLREA